MLNFIKKILNGIYVILIGTKAILQNPILLFFTSCSTILCSLVLLPQFKYIFNNINNISLLSLIALALFNYFLITIIINFFLVSISYNLFHIYQNKPKTILQALSNSLKNLTKIITRTLKFDIFHYFLTPFSNPITAPWELSTFLVLPIIANESYTGNLIHHSSFHLKKLGDREPSFNLIWSNIALFALIFILTIPLDYTLTTIVILLAANIALAGQTVFKTAVYAFCQDIENPVFNKKTYGKYFQIH